MELDPRETTTRGESSRGTVAIPAHSVGLRLVNKKELPVRSYTISSYVPLTDKQLLEEILKQLATNKNQSADNRRTMSDVLAESEDRYVLDLHLPGSEDGLFNGPRLDSGHFAVGTVKREPPPERDISNRSQQTSPSEVIDLTEGTEAPTPAPPGVTQLTGVVEWIREILPLRRTFNDDDEQGNPQRIQLYNVEGRKLKDSDLRNPQEWRHIAAVRRGARIESAPYTSMCYDDYVELKCTSDLRACYYSTWHDREEWWQAVPACVTIYQVNPQAEKKARAYWATVETAVVKTDGRLTSRFSILETILGPTSRELTLDPIERMGVRRVSRGSAPARPVAAASGGNVSPDARGGVEEHGRNLTRVPSRFSPPYPAPHAARCRDYSKKAKYDSYNHYSPEPRSSITRLLRSPGDPRPSASQTSVGQPATPAETLMLPPPRTPTPLTPATPNPAPPLTPAQKTSPVVQAVPATPSPVHKSPSFASYSHKKGDRKMAKIRPGHQSRMTPK